MHTLSTDIIEEITPCQINKTFNIERREKTKFDFPIHTHKEMEINLLIGCKGAMRIVGDSVTELEDIDLTFVGPGLNHGWLQHKCKSGRIKEITIQFLPVIFYEPYLDINRLDAMRTLIRDSCRGVTFEYETILENYAAIKSLSTLTDTFEQLMLLTKLVYNLANSGSYSILASESYTENQAVNPSRRITKVQGYINDHYSGKITLAELAELVGMTIPAFAKFFKQSTSKTVGQFILDVRMGVASRLLINTRSSISEICYECGFNNVSHFCRIFRQYKGYSPGEFRQLYFR